ncbi:YacL family protein, partial [Glaesserella parasuis]|nr:YacL family protein [Glaesserella parasuis]MDE3971351.1 YacL family protein [Glaesserella parasuis]MDE3991808.1 YacL family protein [Glaesserella parasuis]MDE3992222.1 YacL family protein [Glaesserella parasuis]
VENGFSFYDEESIAFCGLEDFEMFLNAYQKFIQTYH